ncbi:hypothetical protein CEB3_c00370 [Peptococcaceae bacterium CEB3]|nr:hypothetical protein CEB3_c00370 [Peptococcaceae bacterium CEB3]
MHERFPRNLGGTVTSIFSVRRGYRNNNSGLPMAWSQPLGGANNENKDGTAKRRKRSAAGSVTASRNAVIVPMK